MRRFLYLVLCYLLLLGSNPAFSLYQGMVGKSGSVGKVGIVGGPSAASASPTIVQICQSNDGVTSLSCGTALTGLTSSNYIVTIGRSGNATLNQAPSGTGAGCPSSWTAIGTLWSLNGGTDNMAMNIGQAQTGSCTPSVSQTGAATSMVIWAYSLANVTGSADGVGNCFYSNTGPQTENGASYTTTHAVDIVLAAIVEQSFAADSSFAVSSPFISTSPSIVSTAQPNNGFPQGAVYLNQTVAGLQQIVWTQGISAQNYSCIIGIF